MILKKGIFNHWKKAVNCKFGKEKQENVLHL